MTAWYINRSAGLVAWALLSASVILGVLLSSKLLGKRVRPNWLQDLHRGLSGLAVAFVGVHIAGAVADNYLTFGLKEVLVPGTSAWRPIAIAWGVVTTYLLVAVEASSLLRKHLPRSWWRRIHFLSFPLFLTATAHGVTAGTEMGSELGIAIAALVTATVGGLTAMRVVSELEKAKEPTARRIPERVPTAARPVAPRPVAPRPVAPAYPPAAQAPTAAPVRPATIGARPVAPVQPAAARVATPMPTAVPGRPGTPF
ncbi:MAG: ferric reductase-like transmembrane domain-containing protein [Acidimicrobiales bacterium]